PPDGDGSEISLGDDQEDPERGDEDAGDAQEPQLLSQEQPAQDGNEQGAGRDDPACRRGLRGEKAVGLEPLVERDGEKSEEEEVAEIPSRNRTELAARENDDPQQEHTHREPGPDQRHRRHLAERDLRGHERGSPDGDRERGLEERPRVPGAPGSTPPFTRAPKKRYDRG